MNRVYLVRHAESVANTQGIYQGQTYDTGLSPLGYRQAIQLAGYFKDLPLDAIFTSPLKRTLFTAQLVSVKKGTPVVIDHRLIETNHGQWEGVAKPDIVAHWPQIYSAWQTAPSTVTFPGGESFLDTKNRILLWWEDISKHQGDILVVTHDNIIRILLAHLSNLQLDQIWDLDLFPASVTIIHQDQIEVQNEKSHLKGVMPDLSLHAL